ncbi:MAG: hypothetical protein ACLGI6_10850 [Gammaproteobacteria bacterium]
MIFGTDDSFLASLNDDMGQFRRLDDRRAHSTPEPDDTPPADPKPTPNPDDVPPPANAPVQEPTEPVAPIKA